MRIAIDSNILIYFLEDVKPFSDQVERMLETFMQGKNQGVVSIISVAELLGGFYASRDQDRVDEAKRFLKDLDLGSVAMVPVTFGIADLAAKLRAKRGGRLPDALIVATAIEKNAEILYSQDDDLKRFGRDIKVAKLAG